MQSCRRITSAEVIGRLILLGELGTEFLAGELGTAEELPIATDVSPIGFIVRIGGGRRAFSPRVFFTLLVTTIIPVPPLGPKTAGGS